MDVIWSFQPLSLVSGLAPHSQQPNLVALILTGAPPLSNEIADRPQPGKLVMTSNRSSEQNMSAATKKLISRAKLLVPPMLEKFHKGEYGSSASGGRSSKKAVLTRARRRSTRSDSCHRGQRRLHRSALLLGHGQCPVGLRHGTCALSATPSVENRGCRGGGTSFLLRSLCSPTSSARPRQQR